MVYKNADEARAAATSGRPTAFSQMSVQGTGFLNQPYLYNDPTDPFYQFAFTTDPTMKAQLAQKLNQMLNATPGDNGYKNQYDYMQDLLRKSGLSKSGLTDTNALSNVIIAGAAVNQDPLTFLENYISNIKPKTIKQPDTTTQYAKQVQTALQFKDLGDARQYYNDAYFSTWGSYPTAELDKKFQNSWNAQVKEQNQPTTTKTVTEKVPIYDKKSKPVIDKATGKQKLDKFGNPQYSAIAKDKNGVYRYETKITGTSTAKGEGFTADEQKQFLADFLVANNPDAKWNVDNIGGAAKTLYEGVVAFHKANYTTPPDLTTFSPVLKNVLSSADANAANEYLTQYKNGVRKQTASKYMSLAEFINAGEDADKYVKPMLENLSTLLETNITIDDPFAASIFNFKDDKGNYRMPNAYELNKLVMSHPNYGKTSKAINEAVDLTQNLKSKLGRS